MASNNSGVQQPTHFHNNTTTPSQCKDCGLLLNSAESLEVHLQYHKENLLHKWATQATSSNPGDETNNNNNNNQKNIKRELLANNTIAAADSSDSMKKSPDYSRNTPETIFGHPPTPQSYQSASSPYQNHDNSAFSPNFQNYALKPERTTNTSPNSHYQANYSNFTDPQFFNMDGGNQQQQYAQDFPMHKVPPMQSSSYRYHPYQQSQVSPYDRSQSNSQVSSSSPAYPPQPTPSPSPNQCDKCGYVCESASQLIEHLNITHPPTTSSTVQQQQQHIASFHAANNFTMFHNEQQQIKTEDDAQSEILDLDSHKVHQVYPEDEKQRQNGDLNGHNPHSVTAMLNPWPSPQQKMFQQEQRMFTQEQQKLFQPHHPADFMGAGNVTTSQDGLNSIQAQGYRAFEHLPAQSSAPIISSSQVGNNQPPSAPAPTTKSANWKSNEARRPKTYNCTACNKWFTSSGHLKRHYNTTLHKNAVKSSGQPDPASLPISAHHHPARESSSNKEDQTSSPGEEDTNSMPAQFERPNPIPGLLQQPPNGPYDRQPAPNIHPPLHSPMPPHNPNLSNGSPPNGEAGLSPTTLDSRGLLSLTTTPNTHHGGFNMAPPPMMPIENSQFQMYPNGPAPHVTQVMVINNLNITGEQQLQEDAVLLQQHQQQQEDNNQPLPSFAQFQRYGVVMLSYGDDNVGGGGPATAPYSYYPDPFDNSNEQRSQRYRTGEDEYRLTMLTVADPVPTEEFNINNYSPTNNNNKNINNNNNCDELMDPLYVSESDAKFIVKLEKKAHIKRDYEETTGSPVISSSVEPAKTSEHRCHICDKIFNKACYLTQHNKTFHSGEKPFKCTRCGKRFPSEDTYHEHLAKHAGDKPHKCDQCPKQFNHKTDLRRHMCLHTGQKPYTCATCGKGFIRKDHMLKHGDTHKRKTHAKIAAIGSGR